MDKLNKWQKLLASILICEFTGILSSVFTFSSIPNWYQYLNKPSFSPPNFVFGPVWTTLYFLMGISLYLMWNKRKYLKWFYIQLFFNFIWTFVFFGFKQPAPALILIATLWFSIFMTIKTFYKVNKNAAYLLIPYILWVSFASLLNLSIVLLNK